MKYEFQRLLALSLYEWCLLLSALLLLPGTAGLLLLLGYKRTRAFTDHFTPARSSDIQHNKLTIKKVRITARMVSIASSYGPYRANCLKQSLVLSWLLAWQGIVSEIKFGIQKNPTATFSPHTWVEYNGESLSDSYEFHQQLLVFK